MTNVTYVVGQADRENGYVVLWAGPSLEQARSYCQSIRFGDVLLTRFTANSTRRELIWAAEVVNGSLEVYVNRLDKEKEREQIAK